MSVERAVYHFTNGLHFASFSYTPYLSNTVPFENQPLNVLCAYQLSSVVCSLKLPKYLIGKSYLQVALYA